jgi:FkbM family methyltransferase
MDAPRRHRNGSLWLIELLRKAQFLPGYPGRSAGRKLRRQLWSQTQARFDAVLAGLGPQDSVLDLGANVGTITARLAATGAAVHAYEPDPDTFARLTANVGHLPNVRLYPEAVAVRTGRLQLYRARADVLVDARLRSESASILFVARHGDSSNSVDVNVVSFAEALARAGGEVNLVKMDIEGAEMAILSDLMPPDVTSDDVGAMALPFKHMFVETHERMLPEHWPEIRRLRKLLQDVQRPEIDLYWK